MYVSFATIPSRFQNIKPTILSWLNQTEKINKIIISIPEKIKNNKSYDIKELKDQIKEFGNKVVLQILPEDLGPITKIIGALFYEYNSNSSNNYIICDDNLIYDKNLVKKYKDNMKIYPNSILSFFGDEHRILKNDMLHVQGADTYLLQSIFFKKENLLSFIEYVKNFQNQFKDAFYLDDYVVSFRFYILGFDVKSCKKDSDIIYVINEKNQIDELQDDPENFIRENNIKSFLKNILESII
jgi:hypothetical protein